MEKKLILRGLLAGAVAGALAFIFARIFAEPYIDKAISYQTGRDAAQALLDKTAGLPLPPPAPDIFSRTIQANIGMLFAVTYAICLGRTGNLRPRTLALAVAAAGFLGIYFVPFVKYPSNPPSIGNPETIRQRGGLYLLMVLASIVLLVLAVMVGRRLQARFGNWNASLIAGAAFVVAIGIVMAVLPALGHLAYNQQHFGNQATETPLPLVNARGIIVYPGFPADVLFSFRLYSVAAQLILWAAIGLLFGPMAERVLQPLRSPAGAEPAPEPAAV